jgi:hypothetical protein
MQFGVIGTFEKSCEEEQESIRGSIVTRPLEIGAVKEKVAYPFEREMQIGAPAVRIKRSQSIDADNGVDMEPMIVKIRLKFVQEND